MTDTTDTFTYPCTSCGAIKIVIASAEQPHECAPLHATIQKVINEQWREGYTFGLTEPRTVWVVTNADGVLGIFGTEALAQHHATRFKDDTIDIEEDVLRFEPMHELDDTALAEGVSL